MPEVKEIFGPTYKKNFSIDEIYCQDGSKVENPFGLKIDEEIDYARNCPIDYQKCYISRLLTLEASRKIINETFDFQSVDNGAEFGCGIYGWLYNYFLPKEIKWRQFDINPKAVEYNKYYTKEIFDETPEIDVGNLYEMPLEDSSVDAIVGLSCWDSIYFFKEAVKEVDRCLQPGGWFIHYQDLLPADKTLIVTEAGKRIERGLKSDVPIEVHAETIPLNVPGFFKKEYYFLSIDSLDFGLVRLGEYLTKHLANLFKDAGFNIYISDERESEIIVKKSEFEKLIKKHRTKLDDPENYFLTAYGKDIKKYKSSIPEGYIKQHSFMDVLVAQKQ